jgi:hypothetical protein
MKMSKQDLLQFAKGKEPETMKIRTGDDGVPPAKYWIEVTQPGFPVSTWKFASAADRDSVISLYKHAKLI